MDLKKFMELRLIREENGWTFEIKEYTAHRAYYFVKGAKEELIYKEEKTAS